MTLWVQESHRVEVVLRTAITYTPDVELRLIDFYRKGRKERKEKQGIDNKEVKKGLLRKEYYELLAISTQLCASLRSLRFAF